MRPAPRPTGPAPLTATAALAAVLLLTACGGTTGGGTGGGSAAPSPGAGSCEGLSIGVFAALTGPYANLGGNVRDAARLAVEQHNAREGACEVGLREYDSQGAPEQATGLAVQAVRDEEVVGLVGPAFSGESKVAFPVMAEGDLVGLSTATNPALTANGWTNFFRTLSNDATQGPAAVTYLRQRGVQRVFVVDDGSEYGKGLADLVRQGLGGAVAESTTVQTGQTDFSAVVTAVRASGADAVYFGGYYAEAGLLVRQLRDNGVQALFVTDDAAKDQGLLDTAGAAAEGVVLTCPCLPPEESGGTFAADHRARFGADPGTYAAESFDAANILLAGLDAGRTTRAQLRDFVASYTGTGVSKEWGFTSTGEPTSTSVWTYVVRGGAITTGEEVGP